MDVRVSLKGNTAHWRPAVKLTYEDYDDPAATPGRAGSPPDLWTVGTIADRLQVPVHRVRYQVDRRKIQHSARAGHVRLFDRQAVQLIRDGIRAAEARKGWIGGGR